MGPTIAPTPKLTKKEFVHQQKVLGRLFSTGYEEVTEKTKKQTKKKKQRKIEQTHIMPTIPAYMGRFCIGILCATTT